MARKPTTTPPPPEVPEIHPAVVASIEAAQNALGAQATAQEQACESAQALALQMGYVGSLSVGAVEDRIRFYQQRTVEGVFELGKSLLILKELSPHGQFQGRVELLGFNVKTAQRFMNSARKFFKSDKMSFLSEKIGTQSKLLELLVLDDDEANTLAEGGTVRGIDLDAIECMSPSELRKALRESKEDLSAARERAGEIAKKLESQRGARPKKDNTPWADDAREWAAEASRCTREAALNIGHLRATIDAATQAGYDDEGFAETMNQLAERVAAGIMEIRQATRRVTKFYLKTLARECDNLQTVQAITNASFADDSLNDPDADLAVMPVTTAGE